MSPSVLALPPGSAQDRFKLLCTAQPPEFIPRSSGFQPLPTWIGLRSLHPSVPSPVLVGFVRMSLKRSALGPEPDPHLALGTPTSGAHRDARDLSNLEPFAPPSLGARCVGLGSWAISLPGLLWSCGSPHLHHSAPHGLILRCQSRSH